MGKKYTLFISLLFSFVFSLLLFSKPSHAQQELMCGGCEERKVTICHATSSPVNPYNQISVDKNGTVSGHDGHVRDIIPPFDYWGQVCHGPIRSQVCVPFPMHYPGKNWDTEGQAIWNNDCEIPYVECSETKTRYGDWSDWKDDLSDETQEMRRREFVSYDARDKGVICDRGFDFEYRYKECSRTVRSFGEWSLWMEDPSDPMQEYRERNAYAVDSQNSEIICVGPIVQTEYRDKEEDPEPCEYTTEIYGDWSDWAVDPSDDTREFRQRTVTTVDSEDNQMLCGDPTIEKEYREIEEEGEVLGTSDVTIVYADTSGGSNIVLAQYALMILTGLSCILVGVKYLHV